MIKEIFDTLTPGGKRSLTVSIVCFALYALSGITMMLLVLCTLKDIMNGGAKLLPYWLSLTFCLFIKGMTNIIADKQKHYAGFDLVYQIREKIVYRLKNFSLGFYTNERLGEISTVIHKDVDNMELVVGHMWTRMCGDFVVSAVLLVGLLILNPPMGLLMISVLPFAFLWLKLGLKKAEGIEMKNGDDLADMVSLFVEYVKGIPLLKAFSDSKKFDQRLADATSEFGLSSKKAAKNKAAILSIYTFLVDAAYWIMVTGGMALLFTGRLSLMHFLVFIVVSREFYKPFFAMETHWMNYLKVRDSFLRIRKVIKAPTVPEPKQPKYPKDASIDFQNVSFSYEKGGFYMDDISFFTPQHTLTALVGESGSGKTTVTNLLLRFWDVQKGSVKIGGVDIRDMGYDDLLGSISIVMQNVQLFADTIEGNIRIGKRSATTDQVMAAAKKSCIHDYIMTLPEGYQTVIGENGVGLSGGQKQRISIARAFLKDAPILLLDEVTSNVDPINETLIQAAISELAKNRTVLVVAHHLSAIRSADQIIVFKNGHIVQVGRHEELMGDARGYYWHLCKAQAGRDEFVSNDGIYI